MKFAEALEALKQGAKIKLPSWKGYWAKEDNTVKMYCKDGRVLDIRETEDVFYTLKNISSEEWMLAEEADIDLSIHTLRFAEALRKAQAGERIARKGWNGKGMSVVYQKGYPEGIPCNKQTAEAWGINEGDLFKCSPYLQIRCADGTYSMWVPSINDILAEDWFTV